MDSGHRLRELLARYLDWEDAHVGFERAVADFPPELRGVVPPGFAHSGWQLLEHLRLAQADILDFCINAGYVYPTSMEAYWPAVGPEDETAWDESVARFAEDRDALKRLVLDESVNLFELVPIGRGEHTYLREVLVAADHNAYHLGQFVALRRALGAWTN